MNVFLQIPQKEYDSVIYHLFKKSLPDEEAAFIFAQIVSENDSLIFQYIDWLPISPDGFACQSEYFFELTDETRALVIKRAHDLGASLIEIHSHTGPWPAAFSFSDYKGFEEFVPHVLWRLKDRPYAAIVVTCSGFDGLVWINKHDQPQALNSIIIEGNILRSTGLSINKDYFCDK